MSTEPQKCVRCRQPLPAGSGFCVSCGHNNEAALLERQDKVLGKANDRIAWAQGVRQWLRGFSFLRWL
jgi:hypothetical protein